MQIMIDTVADDAAQLYKFGKYLIDNFSAGAPQEQVKTSLVSAETQAVIDALVPSPSPTLTGTLVPPPPPLLTIGNVEEGDDDLDIEPDDASAPPPPPAQNVELDSAGVPYDPAIHAANRAKTIKGTWKNRRGLSEAKKTPGNEPTPTIAPFPLAPPPPSASDAPSAVTPLAPPATAFAPTVAPAAAPTIAPATAAPAAAGITAAPTDFRGLMQKIQRETAAGRLSTDQVNGALAAVGLQPTEMAQLINNAPLIASVNAALDACLS